MLFFILSISGLFYNPNSTKSDNDNILYIDDSKLEEILGEDNEDRLIVLDFYADWCGPCKRMNPIIEKVAGEHGSDILFCKIDVDANQTDDILKIESIPYFVIIKNNKVVKVLEGSKSYDEFSRIINQYID